MTLLPNTNPSVHEQLQVGDFAASCTGKPFSKVPIDQTLETTIKKDSKDTEAGWALVLIPFQYKNG